MSRPVIESAAGRSESERPRKSYFFCPRQPTQERGTRRVEAILDAAAALVVEVGTEGITVQALAARAETSKGSLYHFFPDVPSVLRALAARHADAVTSLVETMIAREEQSWPTLSVDELVDRFLAPLAYLESHPDLLALVRAPRLLDRSIEGVRALHDLAEHVLRARFPDLGIEALRVRSFMMVAVVDGAVGTAVRGATCSAAPVRRELERMLAGYLRS